MLLEDNNYSVGVYVEYQLVDESGTDDCYTQEIDVVVRNK